MQSNDALIGQQFGDFVVEDRIGRGGMASVYRARQLSVKRDVALKIIDLSQVNEADDFERRFANEAEFIAKLEHIHILPVYAYGIENGKAYLAMRLLRGGSIKDLLRDHSKLPPAQAIGLFRQMAQGLAHAHSKGVIHRDIKPANVLVDDAGNAYLMDFGLAKLVNAEVDMTRNDILVGTLAYMSPEHLRGEKLDQRTDVYSAGIMLYEMLTGHVPFENDPNDSSAVSVVYKHLEAMPPLMRDYNPDVPYELEEVVLKALAKKREDRYQDMGEFVRAVDNAMGVYSSVHLPKAASRFIGQSSTTMRRVNPPKSRLPLFVGVGVVAALVIAVVAAVILSGSPAAIAPFSIARGTSQLWTATTPSEVQVAAAQRKLGDSGFVAIVACNQDSEYHSTLTRETADELTKHKLRFRVYDSQSDSYVQRREIEKALTDGASAFVLCPIDFEIIHDSLLAINERKLPLLSYHTLSEDVQAVFTAQGATNDAMGYTIGKAAGMHIRDVLGGEAQVVILDYPDVASVVERANGIVRGMKDFAPKVEVVARVVGGTRDFGRQSVERLLRDGVTFNVIGSINDAGAIGAIDALAAAEIAPDSVDIFSVDAEDLTVRYIRDGYYMVASLDVGRKPTAITSANMMVRMLAGDTVPEMVSIPLPDAPTTKASLTR